MAAKMTKFEPLTFQVYSRSSNVTGVVKSSKLLIYTSLASIQATTCLCMPILWPLTFQGHWRSNSRSPLESTYMSLYMLAMDHENPTITVWPSYKASKFRDLDFDLSQWLKVKFKVTIRKSIHDFIYVGNGPGTTNYHRLCYIGQFSLTWERPIILYPKISKL